MVRRPENDAPPGPASLDLDDPLAEPTAEELAAAEALRQALEGGPWTPPVASLEQPAARLARTAAPLLSDLDHQRVRRRLTDDLARRAPVAAEPARGLLRRPVGRLMALAASLVLVLGAGLMARRYLPTPGSGGAPAQPYAQVFTTPFDRSSSAVDRLDRMIAWREGRLAQGAVIGPGARAEVQP